MKTVLPLFGAAALAVALKLVARKVAPVTPPVALPKSDA
jgi:hypothetical protein